MTRAQAEIECARLAAAHPDRGCTTWRAYEQSDGRWTVVRIPLSPAPPARATKTVAGRMPLGDDPRPGPFRDAPPYAAGV